MGILFSGAGFFAGAFILHTLIWRIGLPHKQTRALLIIFFGAYIIGILLWNKIPGIPRLNSAMEYLHSALLFTALALGYVITYSAIEAESPTLVMTRILGRRGQEGILPEEFAALASNDILVRPRLKDLIRDGLAELRDGKYIITPQGRRFVSIFLFYRRLMAAPRKGG